jgi:hypothetical protein
MVYRVPDFKFGGFMGLITSITFCLCALLERTLRGDFSRKGDGKDYIVLSVLTAAGVYFTNWYLLVWLLAVFRFLLTCSPRAACRSLNFINYPMRVMFKSAKLIPTMIIGIFITGRHYTMVRAAAGYFASHTPLSYTPLSHTLLSYAPQEQYAVAGLLVVGIICFAMADARGSPKFDVRGLALVSIGTTSVDRYYSLACTRVDRYY